MKKIVKKAASVLASAAMLLSGAFGALPVGNTVFADSSRVFNYCFFENSYTDYERIEKEVTLYYLEDPIAKMGYSIPAGLPTSYNIPEWEDYQWYSGYITFYIDKDEFNNGLITMGAYEKKRVTKAFRSSDYCVKDGFFGLDHTNKKMIHYTVKFINYANTLREQKVKEWVSENITPGMTDREKAEKVVRKTTYGAYSGGVDCILGTSDGDCIAYSTSALYFFKELGLPARIRVAHFTLSDDKMHLCSISNHHNNWVILDGDIYEVECTPVGGKTEESPTSDWIIDIRLNNVSKRTSGLMTDGRFAYYLLGDGTLELYDIIGLEERNTLPEVWTVPTSTVINGKTYRISRLGPVGWLTASISTLTYSNTYFPGVKQIVIPKGVTFDDDYYSCLDNFYFPDLEKVTFNEDIDSICSVDLSCVVDATNCVIDRMTVEENGSAYRIRTGNATYYAKSFGQEVLDAYEEDTNNNGASYYLCALDDPNACDLTIKVPSPDNGSLLLAMDNHRGRVKPLSYEDGTYHFPGMAAGNYTVRYTNDKGEKKSFPLVLSAGEKEFIITNNMLYSTSFKINCSSYIEDTLPDMKITNAKGKTIPFELSEYVYNGFSINNLSDGTNILSVKLPGWPAVKVNVTITNGKPASELYEVDLNRYGDADSNGSTNLKDFVMLQRYLNKWAVDIDLTVLDLNNDGKVNLKDLVLLQRWLNNWNIVFD